VDKLKDKEAVIPGAGDGFMNELQKAMKRRQTQNQL